jgi:hypothetical protein
MELAGLKPVTSLGAMRRQDEMTGTARGHESSVFTSVLASAPVWRIIESR